MSDAMQKEVISLMSFNYKKSDDTATEERAVFVTESGPAFVRGICADKKQWRSFSRSKMSDVDYTPWRMAGWTAEYVVGTLLKGR